MEKIRLALIGTGNITGEALDALQKVPAFLPYAIFARPHSRDKALALAEKYQIEHISTDYEQLLSDPQIDFVYLALINSVHYDYAQKALLAGKNVILEKPATPHYAQTAALVELAQQQDCYLFEAVTTLHLPNFQLLQAQLADIGKLRLCQCNFSQYSSRYTRYLAGDIAPVFTPAAYGGALYDLNVYNFNLIIGLLGIPTDVIYYPNLGPNIIDTSGTAILRYRDHLAICTAAKDSDSPCFAIFQGEKGSLTVKGAPNSLPEITISLAGQQATVNNNQYSNRMVSEFLAFAQIYQQKDKAKMLAYLQIAQNVCAALEKAAQSAKINYV